MITPAFSLDTGASTAPLSARIQAVVQQALDDGRLVGAVVLVARNGELIHQQAAGWADRESVRPMALDAIFRLASVSKPIVSVAALALVAQGRLDLDEDIIRWMPTFQLRLADGSPARVTARQLLSHTAGLGYRFFETHADGPYAQAGVSDGMDASGISLAENLRRIASVPLQYVPGEGWGYSLATDVLGALIERIYGTSLGEAVRQLVTDPLGMHDTGFVVRDPSRLTIAYVNDTPQPHRLTEGEIVSPFEGAIGIAYSPARICDPQAFPSGGAGMAGTAGDLLRLLEALRKGGGAPLPDVLIEEMEHDQTQGLELPNAPGCGFGLGFSVLRDPLLAGSPESSGTWRWGGAYGHSWFVDRTQGLSVVAFTNTMYEGMSGSFVTELRDAVYGELEAAR
ncbi:beta-lactamase family protein [Pectobacterium brasiliense]|uniref:serine hydrolase domain-containing protein n=1 Tax=Pectobacterium brasiliense TaxID=180957 RepID=UPI0006937D37|nr:serine hydrolase domain-containing protein [Pectobacterium brasiliense]MBN3099376.1 beta-lactamase family protein [Pectobacterium brasiliense]MBN3100384.1 beta-lactamase family protein [Pectobacterium brasiliense]MBN3166749.1 beta-lactamase family protein [Pectobacterium brasiliense]MBN3182895.1 beta-lactamase family protein [Pectobacterium brasiliense]PPE64462.1 serine hydrolase [Pectobacterium brasiliense]